MPPRCGGRGKGSPRVWGGSSPRGKLSVDAVVAEDGVQGRLIVPGAFGQALEHQQARHAELPAGEGPRTGAAHADRPGRRLTAGQFGSGLDVDDVRGRREDGPGAKRGTAPP